jgi:hypothetical protein
MSASIRTSRLREIRRVNYKELRPDRTLTLALPKTGLHKAPGELYLADIGIPPEVYGRLGFKFEPFFKNRYWWRLASAPHSIC